MKKKLVIVISLITFLVIIFVFFIRNQNYNYININNVLYLKCSKVNCVSKEAFKTKQRQVTFDIYVDQIFNKQTKLKNIVSYNYPWYIKDQQVKTIASSRIVSISGKYHKKDYDVLKLNEKDLIYLAQIIGYRENNLSINQKIEIDIDNDNKKEIIYAASNIENKEEKKKVFSLLYIVDNKKIKFIVKNIKQSDYELSLYKYEIVQLMDIDNDKKQEIIVQKNNYLNENYYLQIYKERFGSYYKTQDYKKEK